MVEKYWKWWKKCSAFEQQPINLHLFPTRRSEWNDFLRSDGYKKARRWTSDKERCSLTPAVWTWHTWWGCFARSHSLVSHPHPERSGDWWYIQHRLVACRVHGWGPNWFWTDWESQPLPLASSKTMSKNFMTFQAWMSNHKHCNVAFEVTSCCTYLKQHAITCCKSCACKNKGGHC